MTGCGSIGRLPNGSSYEESQQPPAQDAQQPGRSSRLTMLALCKAGLGV